ncbi:MAG TPA: hotdog domain-containing protein [Thermaerobacter sp.]
MGDENLKRGGAGSPAPPVQRGEPMDGQTPHEPQPKGEAMAAAGAPGPAPGQRPSPAPSPVAETAHPPAAGTAAVSAALAPSLAPWAAPGSTAGEPGDRGDAVVPPARPARESRVEMTELVLPNDANPLGNILGGKVMHLMDIAGALAASRHSRRVCVTASVDRIDFLHPIRVGEAILLEAQVTDAGRTSMEVRVNVYSENLRTGQRRHTATAFFTFVALDEHGRPTPVPAVIAETPDEQRLQAEARRRRQERLARAGRPDGAAVPASPGAPGGPAGAGAAAGAPAPAPQGPGASAEARPASAASPASPGTAAGGDPGRGGGPHG